MDTNKSTSRRQGRLREEGSEGSPMANVRDDGQKPHIRLSPWASRHNTSEAHRFGGRVNAAFVHGKFTFLSGEICASRDRKFMRNNPERSIRFNNDPAYSVAVDGYDSQPLRPSATPPCNKAGSLWETRNRQQLMSNSIAPFVETRWVNTQKSAEGIVVVIDEGPNVEKRMTLP